MNERVVPKEIRTEVVLSSNMLLRPNADPNERDLLRKLMIRELVEKAMEYGVSFDFGDIAWEDTQEAAYHSEYVIHGLHASITARSK